MDFRKVFHSIPKEFDKWRTGYCDELFADVIEYSKLHSGKTVLEIGLRTGQATESILNAVIITKQENLALMSISHG